MSHLIKKLIKMINRQELKYYAKEIVVCALAVMLTFFIVYSSVLKDRLVQTRQQLESARMELRAASDREQDIRATVRRADEILCKSVVTITDIREQIAEVRKSYEEMEALLNNSSAYSNRSYNMDSSKEIE